MTKEMRFQLTDWARINFRFIAELNSLGRHDEAHRFKYNPVSADDLIEISQNPGLANLIIDRPGANQEDLPPPGETQQ